MGIENTKDFTRKPKYEAMVYSNSEKFEIQSDSDKSKKNEKVDIDMYRNDPELLGAEEEMLKKYRQKKETVSETKSAAESSVEFGISKPEKVLEKERVSSKKADKGTVNKAEKLTKILEEKEVESAKEKESNLLRESFVKAQLDFERAKQAGGFDRADYDKKTVPSREKFNEAKKAYFEFLKNNEGLTSEEKGKFVSEEFNKLQDIKTDLRSEEEAKKSYFPFNTIKTIGNWYREQSSKQKYAVAATLLGGGILAGFMGVGAAVALPLGLALTVSRVLSGAGTAVALDKAIAQGRGKIGSWHVGHKGLMEEKTAEEIEKIKKGLTVESAADFFEKNEGDLSAASERLYKESKGLETQRALISGAMGAVIATGAFSEAIKNVMHWTGADKVMKDAFAWTKEHLGFGGHEKDAVLANSAVNQETQNNIEAQNLAESERIKDLATIRKGEGVIHVFQRQLEDNPVKFGFTGDVNNPAEVDKWVHQKAYDIAIKEGYIVEKGEVIVSGTQRVLEKDPFYYGFTGDVNNAEEVRKWALAEAGDVSSKTGTDLPGTLETRVKWDYSQTPENQASFALSSDGKVTEAISSVKHPEYLYDTTGVAKTQEELGFINEQIKAGDANIEKLNVDVAKEARRRLATGMGSFRAENQLNEALKNSDALVEQKKILEDQLKFFSGGDSVKAEVPAGNNDAVEVINKSVSTKAEIATGEVVDNRLDELEAEIINLKNDRGASMTRGNYDIDKNIDKLETEIGNLKNDKGIAMTKGDYDIDKNIDKLEAEINNLKKNIHQVNAGAVPEHDYYSDIKNAPIIEEKPSNFVELAKNKINTPATAVESIAGVESQDSFGRSRDYLKILKKDWLKEALNRTSGVKRSIAEDIINMRARGIYHDQELIKQLEKNGQGSGQKVVLLKKGILNAVANLEKNYGKIFNISKLK